MSEKRKYLRFDVLMNAICRTGNVFKKVKIQNFGGKGIGVLSKGSFAPGDGCEVEMTIPGDNIPVIVEGQIAWTTTPDSKSSDHKSGITFRKISNDDKSRVLEYIYKKMEEK